MANIIVDFDGHTTPGNESMDPCTPYFGETFHLQRLLKKRTFDLVISLFKVNFKDHPIQFLSVQFMDRLMQDYHPINDVSPLHKGCLSRSNHMVCHRIKPNSCGLCKNLEANVKKIDRPILLDPCCVIRL